MPDHLRQPQNAMGPRSPAGSDSPLSLVIGRRENPHHLDHHHHLIHNKTPPPPPFSSQHEGGHSSGFSEASGESPNDSPIRIRSPETNPAEDQPLSLVVPKKHYDDSGADEDSNPTSDPKENLLKIKDFAKFNLGEDARDKIPIHREDTLLAALTAPPKMKTGAPVVPGGSAVVVEHDHQDAMSEMSDSLSSMSDLIQGQRIGEHTVYPCDFCDKIFGNKYHLASHLVTHTGERSFECKFCQKTFGRRSTLRAHMTTHTKTSNFMCPLCEKACNDNNSLEEHIRMHTGEKPFVCTICAKAYARKSHLNVHYRVHTGERPFVCMSCGKDFTEKRFLNDHMQTAHSGNDGPLKCPNCFREFAYKTSLKQHLKKQMCAKNLNRGQPNNPGSAAQGASQNANNAGGIHAKQFACPFCEKSYSWKQTLKQHVSMYHRNKVHTDEFWKYELAKHRRTVLDSKTNEDMWKKQLGKHANEEELQQQRSRSLEIVDRSKQSHHVDDRWLDQIKRTTSSDANQNSQVSTEMKLLALQSLQNSLQMMSMKLPTAPPKVQEEEKKLNSPAEPSKEGYLTLLAHLSAQRSKASEQEQTSAPPRVGQRSQSESSGMPPYLSEMKEECATKRTQMWLAQLGQYRQKNSFQDEMDRNHEELWEEQIAKVKQFPVKSPLEPIEITIEDQEQDIKAGLKAVLPPPVSEEPPSPPALNVISIKTSAIQRVENQPRTFSLSLEINNNDQQQQQQPPRHIPVPLLPTSKPLMALVQNQAGPKRKLLDIPDDDPIIHVQEQESTDDDQAVIHVESKEPVEDQGSVLKSLLMDRLPRKRPLSPAKAEEPPAKRLSLASTAGGESDILRRRLLGIKAEAMEEQVLIKPKFQPPTATITSQQQLDEQQGNQGQSSPVDLSKAEPQPQQPMKNYTQTSVLKHLLYRYTSSGKSEDELAAAADN